MPIISVIVPIFNTSQYLDDCINSILGQTFNDLEVILINDGSTDNSHSKCIELQQKDIRIKYLYQTNQGVSHARNVGVAVSTGKYIGFVDSDDIISSDMYELLFHNLIALSGDISVCRLRTIYLDKTASPIEQLTPKCISKSDAIRMFFNGELDFSANNKLFDARILKDLRFEGTLNEDILYNCKSLLKSKKIVIQHIIKYDYLVRRSSKDSISFEEKHLELMHVADNMTKLVEQAINEGILEYECLRFVKNYNLIVHISLINLILRSNNQQFKFVYNNILTSLSKYELEDFEYSALKAKHIISFELIKYSPRIYKWLFKLGSRVLSQ